MHVYDQTYAIERRLLTRWLSLCKCKLIPDLRRAYGIDACIEDPTRASFVFAHSLALSDTSHEVQIFLTADATCLTRKATSDAVIYLLASIFASLRLTQCRTRPGRPIRQVELNLTEFGPVFSRSKPRPWAEASRKFLA